MATTETRSGFRLPWGGDQRADSTDATSADAADAATPDEGAPRSEAPAHEAAAWPSDDPTPTVESPATESSTAAGDTVTDATDTDTATTEPVEPPTDHHAATETTQDAMLDTTAAPTGSAAKRPTKFLADLTKAMRSAAETERAELVGRFQADAKAFTELIQERSGTESTELRKRADDDIVGIRDWSKSEIARIREETDERIAHRRTKLDKEVEAHASRIELEVDRVKSTVDKYEKEMADFFEELGSEEDPSRFAALAAHLPEPPDLDDAIEAVAATGSIDFEEDTAPVTEDTGEAVAEATGEAETETAQTEATAAVEGGEADVDDNTTGEAITEAAESPASDDADETGEVDPRVAALGLTPDFAAAEAEAMAGVDEGDGEGPGEDIPALDDEAIAARLAGLVPAGEDGATDEASTRLVVTGLVSVASIAGFKRHLARLAGVRTVGVSSGPDGEFVFAVSHDPTVDLREVVPTMPGFGARVTGSEDGSLTVSATDPESDT